MAAQLVAVTTASLPLVGYAARVVAFALDGRIGSIDALHLAAATSVVDLAVTGLHTAYVAALAYLLAYVYADKPKEHAAPGPSTPGLSRRKRRLAQGAVIVLSVLWLVLVLGGSVTLSLYYLMAYAVGAFWLGRIWRQRHSLRVAWVWPVLLACLIFGAIDYGVYFTDAPVADLTLSPAAGVPSGWYVQVGDSNDTVYVLSCGTSTGVIGLPRTAILRVEYATQSQIQAVKQTVPSIIDLLTGQAAQPAGLQMRCP